MPSHLRETILSHFSFILKQRSAIDERVAHELLPDLFRMQLNIEYGAALNSIAMFRECTPAFLSNLVTRLRPEVYFHFTLFQFCFFTLFKLDFFTIFLSLITNNNNKRFMLLENI